jgi:fumarate reductase subunit D
MKDLDEALADIAAIRTQIARGSLFRGFGPMTMAATGALALLAATIQAVWIADPASDVASYLVLWIGAAVVSVALIAVETFTRSHRIHSGLADEMIHGAIEQFLPAGAAGALLTAVVARFRPQDLSFLPGLWQIIFSLGIFAASRSFPRPIFAAGAWYLASGLAVLSFADQETAFSPWVMGGPFFVGQILIAAILYHGIGDDHG